MKLEGKNVVVTGGAGGIGAALARRFHAEGAAGITLADIQAAPLNAVAEAVGGLAVVCDVTDETAVQALVRRAEAACGPIDVFCSNAGVALTGDESAPDADWRLTWEVHVMAHVYAARSVAPGMAARGSGRIIMTGSIMGFVARPGVAAYVAAKGGIAALTRALAVELGPRGVTCNAIAPGYITTDMTAPLAADPAFDARVRQGTPVGRWGAPEEIGYAAVYLASDAAAYVNGHILTVDGGMIVSI